MRKAIWPGEWKALCDVCGFQFPSGDLMKRWDGIMACPKDYETRHPMDFLRTRPETSVPTFVRPEPATDTFVSVTYPFALDDPTH